MLLGARLPEIVGKKYTLGRYKRDFGEMELGSRQKQEED